MIKNSGILGDCYFLSSCAAIAEQDYRIKKLFAYKDPATKRIAQLEDINPQGIYSVYVCEKGVWKEIVVDDQIACDSRGEFFLFNFYYYAYLKVIPSSRRVMVLNFG